MLISISDALVKKNKNRKFILEKVFFIFLEVWLYKFQIFFIIVVFLTNVSEH